MRARRLRRRELALARQLQGRVLGGPGEDPELVCFVVVIIIMGRSILYTTITWKPFLGLQLC